MNDLFNLKRTIADLDGQNSGSIKHSTEVLNPTRASTGQSFSGGPINFSFARSGRQHWIPSKTFLRLRLKITKKDGALNDVPVTTGDDVALAMGTCSHLFQSMHFNIKNTTVSRIADNIAEIDALKHRTSKSKAWMDSVGQSTNMWTSDFGVRQSMIASDDPTGTVDFLSKLNAGFNALSDVVIDGAGLVTHPLGGTATHTAPLKVGDYLVREGVDYEITGISPVTGLLTVAGAGAGLATSTNFDFKVVQRSLVQLDDNRARKCNTVELMYKPPLSVFDIDHALPTGDYMLSLVPHGGDTYKSRVLESGAPIVIGQGVGEFDVSVEEIVLMVYNVEGPAVLNSSYLLDLNEIRAQTVDVSRSTGYHQRDFDVSPTTHALTMAFGDSRALNDTLFPESKFRVQATRGSKDLAGSLVRYSIAYDGQTLPSPDGDPVYDPSTNTDYSAREYVDSLIATGAYHDHGGAETIQEWDARGRYYCRRFERDAASRATRVKVSYQFNDIIADGANNAIGRLLLFDHYSSRARVNIENGMVTSVNLQDSQ